MNPNNCQATCLNEDQKNDSPFEELAIQLRASYKRKSLEKKELMQRVILAGKRRDLIEDTKLLNYLASLADS